jgi:hypothetical protein
MILIIIDSILAVIAKVISNIISENIKPFHNYLAKLQIRISLNVKFEYSLR